MRRKAGNKRRRAPRRGGNVSGIQFGGRLNQIQFGGGVKPIAFGRFSKILKAARRAAGKVYSDGSKFIKTRVGTPLIKAARDMPDNGGKMIKPMLGRAIQGMPGKRRGTRRFGYVVGEGEAERTAPPKYRAQKVKANNPVYESRVLTSRQRAMMARKFTPRFGEADWDSHTGGMANPLGMWSPFEESQHAYGRKPGDGFSSATGLSGRIQANNLSSYYPRDAGFQGYM